jgi:cell division protein FtsN
MSKDYKRPEPAARSGGSQLLVGILIGLVLGLGIALGVAWYINKMPNPFTTRTPPGKLEPLKPAPSAPSKSEDKTARAPEPKLRFDFYKILPGSEETVTDPQAKDARKPATAGETFFLQAGAFQNPRDADTLRARLALLGVEARIQTATLPDKGVWHRVRVGPYTSVAELGRTRETLKQNGVETTLIKVRDERP